MLHFVIKPGTRKIVLVGVGGGGDILYITLKGTLLICNHLIFVWKHSDYICRYFEIDCELPSKEKSYTNHNLSAQ